MPNAIEAVKDDLSVEWDAEMPDSTHGEVVSLYVVKRGWHG